MFESNNNYTLDTPSADGQIEMQWISLSDLMTGLMMIFLLIAVFYMAQTHDLSQKINPEIVSYKLVRDNLYEALNDEFKYDLPKWGAIIDRRDLSVRFKEPDVLFATGIDQLEPKFETILEDFFPRYIRILTKDEYKDSIKEIRIEGHTSSKWKNAQNEDDAYYKNMALSQARTRSTLIFVLSLPEVQKNKKWLKINMTANGLSSSKLVSKFGVENEKESQRVEFRIRTDAEEKMAKILEQQNEND